MKPNSRLKYEVRNGKPTLIVQVPDEILNGVELKGNNAQVLEGITSRMPGLLTKSRKDTLYSFVREDILQRNGAEIPRKIRYAAGSLRTLFALAEGRATPIQKNVGSSILVKVVDNSGRQRHAAEPPPSFTILDGVKDEIRKSSDRFERRERLGVTPDGKAKADSMLDGFDKIKGVFEAARDGCNKNEIRRLLGVPVPTAYGWLTGLHHSLQLKRRLLYDIMRSVKPARPPREESEDYALFLGAYAGQTGCGHTPSAFDFKSDSLEFMKHIRAGMQAAVKTEIRIIDNGKKGGRGGGRYSINVRLSELLAEVSEATAKNTRMPWEHLGTEKEWKSWIAGYFGAQKVFEGDIKADGTESKARIAFMKKDGKALMEDTAILMHRLGVLANITYKPAGITIDDANDLRELAKELDQTPAGMITPEVRGRLSRITAKRPANAGRRLYTVAEYNAFLKEDPDESGAKISARLAERKFNVPPYKIDQWRGVSIKGHIGNVPLSIKRLRHLEEMEKAKPSPERICELYRTRGFSSEEARTLAGMEHDASMLANSTNLSKAANASVKNFLANWNKWEHSFQMVVMYADYLWKLSPSVAVQTEGSLLMGVKQVKPEDYPQLAQVLRKRETYPAVAGNGRKPEGRSQAEVTNTGRETQSKQPSQTNPPTPIFPATPSTQITDISKALKEIQDSSRKLSAHEKEEVNNSLMTLRERGFLPDIIRISEVLKKAHPDFRKSLLVTASHNINRLNKQCPPVTDWEKEIDSLFSRGVNKMLQQMENGD